MFGRYTVVTADPFPCGQFPAPGKSHVLMVFVPSTVNGPLYPCWNPSLFQYIAHWIVLFGGTSKL